MRSAISKRVSACFRQISSPQEWYAEPSRPAGYPVSARPRRSLDRKEQATMEHPRTILVTLAAATLAASTFAAFAGAAPPAFNGNVCALVPPAAVKTAGLAAPCVQAKSPPHRPRPRRPTSRPGVRPRPAPTTSCRSRSARSRSNNLLRPSRLFPRGPGKLLGPITIAPGIKAYYCSRPTRAQAAAAEPSGSSTSSASCRSRSPTRPATRCRARGGRERSSVEYVALSTAVLGVSGAAAAAPSTG